MRNKIIYDWPLRTTHWLFAVLFLIGFSIAEFVDSENVVFTYHMILGLALLLVVLCRFIWGFVGGRYSKWSSFALHPRDLIKYLLGILKRDKYTWIGHNPASSWGSLAMFLLAIGLGVTGIAMTLGFKEDLEDIHEIFSTAFIVFVGFHIAGLALHTIQHGEWIGLSMLDGKKEATTQEYIKTYPQVALAMLVIVFAGLLYFYSQYDQTSGILNLFGYQLNLQDA